MTETQFGGGTKMEKNGLREVFAAVKALSFHEEMSVKDELLQKNDISLGESFRLSLALRQLRTIAEKIEGRWQA
jgi:hypothetical protein